MFKPSFWRMFIVAGFLLNVAKVLVTKLLVHFPIDDDGRFRPYLHFVTYFPGSAARPLRFGGKKYIRYF